MVWGGSESLSFPTYEENSYLRVRAVKDRMSLRATGLGYSAGLEKGCGDRFDAEFEDICSFSSF